MGLYALVGLIILNDRGDLIKVFKHVFTNSNGLILMLGLMRFLLLLL